MEQDLEGWDEMFEEYDENYDLSDVMGDEGGMESRECNGLTKSWAF